MNKSPNPDDAVDMVMGYLEQNVTDWMLRMVIEYPGSVSGSVTSYVGHRLYPEAIYHYYSVKVTETNAMRCGDQLYMPFFTEDGQYSFFHAHRSSILEWICSFPIMLAVACVVDCVTEITNIIPPLQRDLNVVAYRNGLVFEGTTFIPFDKLQYLKIAASQFHDRVYLPK